MLFFLVQNFHNQHTNPRLFLYSSKSVVYNIIGFSNIEKAYIIAEKSDTSISVTENNLYKDSSETLYKLLDLP